MNSAKKLATLIVLAVIAAVFISLPFAFAGEKLINAKITNIVSRIDKRGNQYVRAIVEEQHTLQGVKYTVGVPVMAFRDTVSQLKTYRIGQNLKAIVSSRQYNGRTSYTLIQALPGKAVSK